MKTPNHRVSLWVVIGLAFALRIVDLCNSSLWKAPLMREPTEEVMLAQGLARGMGYVTPFHQCEGYVAHPSAYSPPAYPYMLAGLIKGCAAFSDDPRLPYRISYLLGDLAAAVGVGLLALIGRFVMGSGGFWVVGILASVWPPLITGSNYLWDTPFSVAGICFTAWLGVQSPKPGEGWRRPLLWGSLAGLFSLFNPVVGPIAFLGLLAFALRNPDRRRGFAHFAAAMAVIALFLAPWTVRNFMEFGHLVPVRNTLGFTMWVGNLPDVDARATSTYKYQIGSNTVEAARLFAIGEDAYMQEKGRQAWDVIGADWQRFWRRTAERFALYWFGDYRNRTVVLGISFPMIGGVNVLKVAINGAMIAMAAAGFIIWGRRPGRWIVLAGLALVPIPFYITHYSSNYRVFTDPLLCVFGGIFAAWAIGRIARMRKGASRGAAI